MIIKLIRNCEAGDSGEIIEVTKEIGEEIIGRREGKLLEEKKIEEKKKATKKEEK